MTDPLLDQVTASARDYLAGRYNPGNPAEATWIPCRLKGIRTYRMAADYGGIRWVYIGHIDSQPGEWALQRACTRCKRVRQINVTGPKGIAPAERRLSRLCKDCQAHLDAQVPCDVCRTWIDPPAEGQLRLCPRCVKAREERLAAEERRAALAAEEAARRKAARQAFAAAVGVELDELD